MPANRGPWSVEMVENLRQLARTTPLSDIARQLGKNKSTVLYMARKYGILFDVKGGGGGRYPRKAVYRAWTQPEDNRLLDMAGTLSYAQAARKLDRTFGEVYRRVRKLGIRWTIEGCSTRDVAKRLGVQPETVSEYKKKLNQNWRRNINWRKSWRKRIMRPPTDFEIQEIARALLEEPRPGSGNLDYSRLKRIIHGEE